MIGSAAILGVFETHKDALLFRSNEADLVALSGDPEIADREVLAERMPMVGGSDADRVLIKNRIERRLR